MEVALEVIIEVGLLDCSGDWAVKRSLNTPRLFFSFFARHNLVDGLQNFSFSSDLNGEGSGSSSNKKLLSFRMYH